VILQLSVLSNGPLFGNSLPVTTKASVSLVMPAFNEEAYVERTVGLALDILSRVSDDYEIVVVNDASTDRTGKICDALSQKHPQVRVIHHTVNQKLGGALKTGFRATTKDVVIYTDIDLPWDLNEIQRALHLLEYLEADMLCAFRFDRTSEGFKRILYSFAYNWLIRIVFNVKMKDINFSFKVIRRQILEAVDLKSSGSFIDAELVVKAIGLGFRVFQMGVDYFPRTRGNSTLASPAVIFKMLRELFSLFGETRRPKKDITPLRTPIHENLLPTPQP